MLTERNKGKAIVCFSGGFDSTLCLHWALEEFDEVIAVSFDYGQSHNRELEAQKIITDMLEVKHVKLDMPFLQQIGGGALTNAEIPFNHDHPILQDLPSTFVPYRNLFLLSACAALGLKLNYLHVVTGVCETDFSGYPDCRRVFIDHLEAALYQAVGSQPGTKIKISTPLMYMTKEESVRMSLRYPRCQDTLQYTHTCYLNEYPPCLTCDSCLLRAKGFKDAGIEDPLINRWIKEDKGEINAQSTSKY